VRNTLFMVVVSAALRSLAHAQDLEPRAFANTPVGLNFLIGGYAYAKGTVGTDASRVSPFFPSMVGRPPVRSRAVNRRQGESIKRLRFLISLTFPSFFPRPLVVLLSFSFRNN
jgi:hypothetical protein